jgi:hypothetical protein
MLLVLLHGCGQRTALLCLLSRARGTHVCLLQQEVPS